jgi:choline dehydrogenase-like flavoprotein
MFRRPHPMAFVTPSSVAEAYDVIVVGSGAAGGQAAYTLTMEGARVLMLEAGRNYDPRTETPMFQTPNGAPLRGAPTPDKPFGFFDATVGAAGRSRVSPIRTPPRTRASSSNGTGRGCWAAGPTTGRDTRCATGPTTLSPTAGTASVSTGRSPMRMSRPTMTRSRC